MTRITFDHNGIAHCTRYGVVLDGALIAKGARRPMRAVARLRGGRVVRLLTIHVIKPDAKS